VITCSLTTFEKAISLTDGDQAGSMPSCRPVVSCRRPPPLALTVQTCQRPLTWLEKASWLPFGDQDGAASVTCADARPAAAAPGGRGERGADHGQQGDGAEPTQERTPDRHPHAVVHRRAVGALNPSYRAVRET
jgi:hypothetical protein